MMHGDSFLQAIRANPDDDALRLICADWLMEQDDPACADRGEFIRLQVERAHLAPGDPRRDALQERERRLPAQLGGVDRPAARAGRQRQGSRAMVVHRFPCGK